MADLTRDQFCALTTRPDLLAQEAHAVADRKMTWQGRLAQLGDYGQAGGSAADRRLVVEAMAAITTERANG